MEYLVLCHCGHSLALHDYAGCAGDRLGSCACVRDRHAALDAAVETAKISPIFPPAYALPGNGGA